MNKKQIIGIAGVSVIVVLILVTFLLNRPVVEDDQIGDFGETEDLGSTDDLSTENEADEIDEEPVVVEEPEEPEIVEPELPISHLTGLPISEEAYARRPVGIMISNIKTALPQYGVSRADIMYETLVEGGIVRMFAVFQDFDETSVKIGPIRSSRHYFLDFALDHDAIYTHVGQSVYAIQAFKNLDVDRFYGISYMDNMLIFYDPDRKRPHSTFTDFDHLMDTWEQVGYRKEPKDMPDKLQFDSENASYTTNDSVNYIKLDYSSGQGTNPEFNYNEEEKVYYRDQFGEPHMDADNDVQLSFTNIVVQFTDIWRIPGDELKCMDMTLIGEGDGFAFTNGKRIPIRWKKADHYSPTQYYLEDGSLLQLNPGKTMISVYPNNRIDDIIME